MTVGRIPVIEGGIQPTIFDAKADLLTATAADTPARLAVGANGTVLTADSAEATGLKWAGFSGVALTKSAAQAIPATTYTSITFDTEDYDTDGYHSTVTNTSRITIPAGKGGYYLVTANLLTPGGSQFAVHKIYKNGSDYKLNTPGLATANGYASSYLTVILPLVAGDYLETAVYTNSGINIDSNAQGPRCAYFAAYYLGA